MRHHKSHLLQLSIIKQSGNVFLLKIFNEKESTLVNYDITSKDFSFNSNNDLDILINNNIESFKKILINKRLDTFYEGFELPIVIMENKVSVSYNDRNKIIVLDRRNSQYQFYTLDSSSEKLTELYTDASFSSKTQKGGYAFIIKDLEGNSKIASFESLHTKSTLLELTAVIEGLKILKKIDRIRVLTDSVYVVKGISEWLPMWKLNKWMTCNGEKVKNIDTWLEADALTDNKYIEFKWIKAHTNHFENSLCDLYAKDMTRSDLAEDKDRV